MKTERVVFWDNVKMFLIISVVAGHMIQGAVDFSDVAKTLFIFVYSWHMPLFIFISGLFQSNKNPIQKIVFYCSIGFLLKILNLFLSVFLGNSQPTFDILGDADLPWFMFVLAIYTGIFYILRNQNKRYLLVATIVLACFTGYDKNIGDFLYLSRAIVFSPFYIAGALFNGQNFLELKKNRLFVAGGWLVFIGWLLSCYVWLDAIYFLRPLFTGRNPFLDTMALSGLYLRILTYLISSILGLAILLIVPTRKIVLTRIGRYSINVYFWHSTVYILCGKYLGFYALFQSSPMGKIVYLLLAVPISLLVSYWKYPVDSIRKYCFFKNATEDRG